MTTYINPSYERWFPGQNAPLHPLGNRWSHFNTQPEHVNKPLNTIPVDFSVDSPEKSWTQTAQAIATFVAKIVIFPWGLYELVRFSMQRFIISFLYPIQTVTYKLLSKGSLDKARKDNVEILQRNDFYVRNVVLAKDGVRYDGLLLGHQDTIENGKWVLRAAENAAHIEDLSVIYHQTYKDFEYNLLLINGPGVGRSGGWATPKTLGEVQELGISFLEQAVKAKTIGLAGRSLGAASLKQAIEQHAFDLNKKYFVTSEMTFDRFTNVAAKIVSSITTTRLESLVKCLIQWAGCEMDSVPGSRKLSELNILEFIIQAGKKVNEEYETVGDGIIAKEASLSFALEQQNFNNKYFRYIPEVGHNHNFDIVTPTLRDISQQHLLTVPL